MLRVAITVFCLAACAQPAAAIFRFDEIDRRSFRYNRDYFLNIFSYRQRLSHRWRFADSSLGYDITAGSLESRLHGLGLAEIPSMRNHHDVISTGCPRFQ